MHKDLKFNILTEGHKNGVTLTCRKYNISRTIYYKWQKRYQSLGIEGLDDIKRNFVPSNKTSQDIENILLQLVKTYPKYGPKALKYLLEELDHSISESAVFNILKRHHLSNKAARIRYAKKKVRSFSGELPKLEDLKSGEAWLFTITDYGNFHSLGPLYVYTFIDLRSKIACSRLYQRISFEHFEDLLNAVALPVARTLNFRTKYLCFYDDAKLIQSAMTTFMSKIDHTLQVNGLDVQPCILRSKEALLPITDLQKNYTENCMSFLLPYIYDDLPLAQLKLHFQRHLRTYNILNPFTYDDQTCTPIEFHNKSTHTELILPLWAYMDRDY